MPILLFFLFQLPTQDIFIQLGLDFQHIICALVVSSASLCIWGLHKITKFFTNVFQVLNNHPIFCRLFPSVHLAKSGNVGHPSLEPRMCFHFFIFMKLRFTKASCELAFNILFSDVLVCVTTNIKNSPKPVFDLHM